MSEFLLQSIFFIVSITTVTLLGILLGALANGMARNQLKNYKENFIAKFRRSLLFGFVLTLFNECYWIGNIFAFTLGIGSSLFLNLPIMFFLMPLWYTFTHIMSRMGFDALHGRSPPKPYVKIEDPLIQGGYAEIYRVLETNLNAAFGKLKRRWAMPAGKYMACYLWDSAFISQVWKYWDDDVAGEILLPLLDSQADDGRVPHFTSFLNKSNLTQPPLIAWAISNLQVDNRYLKKTYFKLKKFNQWLYLNRRFENGLFFWKHSYESGIDNSPRFTDRSEKQRKDLTRIAAVDLNAYVVLQNQSLIKLAARLKEQNGEDLERDVLEFKEKNRELIELIQLYLWDEEAGLYFDYDVFEEKRISLNTIASFIPLAAKIPTETQAERLKEHLENSNEYNTIIPLPTVAINDKLFVKDTWRGPVWLNTAYLIIKGLENYQYYELSGEFALRLIEGVFKTWQNEGSFYEFYDPERFDLRELTRKKGNLWKQITLGGKPVKNFVGWTGLVNPILIESILGYDKLERIIQPRIPGKLKGKTIILGFPQENFELEVIYNDVNDITITLIDLTGLKPNLVKKCSLYQKVMIDDFFGE